MAQAPADALYQDALSACEEGRIVEAVAMLRRALALAPDQVRIHALLGQALVHLGHSEDALASFDRALSIGPATARLHGARADALVALNRLDDAVQSYDRALALDAKSVSDWCNRGAVLHDRGQYEEAAASFSHAAKLAPDFAQAHYNHGNALLALNRHEAAIACFDQAIALEEGLATAHNNRANALDQLGRRLEALSAVERALAIEPSYQEALVTRAVILRKLGRAEQALESCERALALRPDDTEALTVQGDVLVDRERFEQALAAFDRIIALDPGRAAAKWNKSVICLGLGRFEEGWPLYEYRWAGAPGLVPRDYPLPRWGGERLDGALLVWGEQGIGDEILHASMIPDLMQRVGSLRLEVEPRLVSLFSRSFPEVTVAPLGRQYVAGRSVAHMPMASLGGYFRPNWEAFPGRDRGHLLADDVRTQALRKRLDDGRTVIGLSWVSKAPIGGAQKSARLADFEPLLRLQNCRLIDLQYGDTQAERDAVERELGIRVERLAGIDNTNDLDGLASLMCACDAVVTVSNTTAHLAGALGRPTWVMVPHGHARIWYWFRDRDHSPWYPRVRVLRQQSGQGWSSLVEATAAEIGGRG